MTERTDPFLDVCIEDSSEAERAVEPLCYLRACGRAQTAKMTGKYCGHPFTLYLCHIHVLEVYAHTDQGRN
jgi:hypothetical protein